MTPPNPPDAPRIEPQPPVEPDSSAQIIAHYNRFDESQRLRHDIGPLEWERTRELYLRYLPPPPAVILDIGGANGDYSFWLAGLGYSVHLSDITPRHIENARAYAAQAGAPQLASLGVGDARCLDYPDACADAILLHGPLYHLTQLEERLRVLREARRLLKPGGLLMAAAITRYAGLIYGITRGMIFDPAFLAMAETEVRSGLRENPPAYLFTFPQAFFHLPEQLGEEISAAGLRHSVTLGILGPAWQVPDLDAAWQDPPRREAILAVARLTENEPALGPRLLGVAYKA